MYREVTIRRTDTFRYKPGTQARPQTWIIARVTQHESPQRLLVVDDDADIRTLLAEQLTRAGFAVSAAGNGPQMREALAGGQFDLIVLDLNMPREDGLALCRDLRSRSSLPVIMLTARSSPVDRIVGLEMGADDYVTKPFEPRELIARIRNVLRRTGAAQDAAEPVTTGSARFGEWTFDMDKRHLVARTGRVVSLSGAEYRLLRAFVTEPNRVLTREHLVARSSGKPYGSQQRAIDLQISRLRHKLGDDQAESPLIKTVRNEGYVLAAAVTLA
jgi:two-component system OmpR family response regulator